MATASHVELSTNNTGVFRGPAISAESAQTASQVLQENHDKYHIFFNEGFHNHIAHHVLTIYALGATEQEIRKAYDMNKTYQRPQQPVGAKIVQDMSDKANFAKYLGQEEHFHDYEIFFQKEIEARGWETVLNEHLFSGDEHADDLHVRMYAGFLHPIIHLGFGVEFEQPAVIAEALAQAAIHSDWIGKLLLPAEKLAAEKQGSEKSLFDLIKEIQSNEKIINAPHWEDGNKVRDGLLVRAPQEMIAIAAQWQVKPQDLEKKTAEMINAAAYFTGAAQNPPKQVKLDFYYMHCINSSIFFSAFLKQEWLSTRNKICLLEWKGRLDLAMYASRKTPKLMISEIVDYSPKQPTDGWAHIFKRVDRHEDDGHAAKLIRALAHGQQASSHFEREESWPIQGDSWLKLAHMVIDSVEDDGNHWVRGAGFPQAWEQFHDRAKL